MKNLVANYSQQDWPHRQDQSFEEHLGGWKRVLAFGLTEIDQIAIEKSIIQEH